MLWLLILLIILWLVLQPSWLPRRDEVTSRVSRAFQGARERTRTLTSNVGERLPGLPGGRGDSARSEKFKEWLNQQTLSQESELYERLPAHAQGMTAWLATLSDSEMQDFTEQIARFTRSLGLELEWLLNNQLHAYPVLKQAIEEAVALYSVSAWRAYNVKEDVKAFRAYQEWLEHPSRERALQQKLYGELVRQGLVTTTPELYLANEKERDAEAVRAIKQVAETRPEVITAIVREWVTAPDAVRLEATAQSTA
jgi:hypothetical protein